MMPSLSCDCLDVKIWRTAENLEISLDGLSWVSPDMEDHTDVIMIERLAAGVATPLYLRRTIAAESESDGSVTDLIEMSWMGY
jgi:hypothetical protein